MSTPKVYASGPDSRGLYSLIHAGLPLCAPTTLESVQEQAWRLCKVSADKLPRWDMPTGQFLPPAPG